MNVGDEITVHGRDAEVIRILNSKKIQVEFPSGRTTTDYLVRHELPETCRDCDNDATHRVEINAPGNGDTFALCADCADGRAGKYVSVEEVVDR